MAENYQRQIRGLDPRWMTLQQLSERFQQDWDYADDPDAWLRLGSYQGQSVYLSHDRARKHVLLVGADTMGRTSPGLASFWHYFHDSHQSLVFFDPTGELKRLLSPMLSETHAIWEIAPEAPKRSLKYNPLSFVPEIEAGALGSSVTMQGSRYSAAYSLASIYTRYMLPAFPEDYSVLTQLALSLVAACVLHLTATHPEPSFQSLPTLLLRKEQLLPYLSASPDQQAREIAEQLQSLSESYREMLIASLAGSASRFAQFQALDDIQSLTARNEIDFARLLQQPVALFYTLPPFNAQDWHLIIALFYAQLTTTLLQAWPGRSVDIEEATEEMQEVSAPQGIRIVIDQPEILGALPDLEQHVGGWPNSAANIAFVMAVRERNILEKLYGQRAYNLPNAFETHLVLPGISQVDSIFYTERYNYTPASVAEEREDQVSAILPPLITLAQLSKLKNGRALLCPLDLPPAIIAYP